ncbi:serine/threonine-protein kinase [Hyalangium gracile]|uniref:serine/threonine-protein kinase n=1 Tax=Hyalangium gracile TaxID=394092 RepID=UPI001CCA62CE|nr:serine/threonine-protein kinase [Hyalangium gracile]
MADAVPLSDAPAPLPAGTQVGPWRVVAWAGQGAYGAVYRAVPVHAQHLPPVALKVALRPGDARFFREAQLLSRMSHPSVPRLRDSGTWQSPEGTLHPWLTMEWVEGVPLYHWAWNPAVSSRECFGVLAQLARALQALHEMGALHRDFKGENVLVRRADGRAMLTDFGLGCFPGAERLTPAGVCLGTPLYRSPEAGEFELNRRHHRSAPYVHTPADDLYALGMVGCRLLTGEYPEWVEPTQDEQGTWRVRRVRTPASLRGVEPSVRACLVRLLSVSPEQRGTAAECAEVLEQASRPPWAMGPRWSWLAMAAGLTLVVWSGWTVAARFEEKGSLALVRTEEESSLDAGTAGLGEAAASASMAQSLEPSAPAPLAEEPPPDPQPGQVRPDAKGRCPHKRQVALNGACWVPLNLEECEALGSNGNAKMFKGRCYVPALSPERPSTSDSTNTP